VEVLLELLMEALLEMVAILYLTPQPLLVEVVAVTLLQEAPILVVQVMAVPAKIIKMEQLLFLMVELELLVKVMLVVMAGEIQELKEQIQVAVAVLALQDKQEPIV